MNVITTDLVIVGDDRSEDSETVVLDLYHDEGQFSSGYCAEPIDGAVYAQMVVTIEDDDDDAGPRNPGGDLGLEVRETDVDFVSVLMLPLPGHADQTLCYPFDIGYGESTASRADVDLVASTTDFVSVSNGVFIVAAGELRGLTTNILIKGDQVVEPVETVVLYVYASVSLLPGESYCSPSGSPVATVILSIIDDDAPLSIESLRPLAKIN